MTEIAIAVVALIVGYGVGHRSLYRQRERRLDLFWLGRDRRR